MRIALGIAAAGFLGAVTRYEIGFLFPQGSASSFPYATLFINLSGSLLLGLLIGWLSRRSAPAWFGEVMGTGFIGSFTTFSAFNGQLWQLCQHAAYFSAAAYLLLSAVGGWLLATAGLTWGRGAAA
ncbi:fluoride efflux transporter FluC [Cohnella silvisoli]|uniref:Fluoride-specific ion channel FluC n=1 Tax=Cohnella silvisoli TaxID=2873699 RepID=A0ABV1KZY8_9BACL|nr:CrcB family protein [Cohnella silvisoli]MCD9024262.1 CrcB family protein [Cohnella silvisoli]